ncbi:MAG: hypothetical protein KJ711_04650 [Candidatus Omnitrophica bacterium]|nr:hypothetical protein [Candidatus Omnitrophota bacterium]MBU1523189.1 hypothetical protein [Candidatus Omnitrophota bacterium]
MKERYEQLKADVLDEMEAVEEVLKDLSFLKNNLNSDKIDNVQKAALGTFLMNFYVGVENIVKRKGRGRSDPFPCNFQKRLIT